MFKKALFAGAGLAFLALPLVTSAATIASLKAEISALLVQLQALELQSTSSVSVATSSPAHPMQPVPCYSFGRSLQVGSRGSDVVALQDFLFARGYLDASSTGYFGPLTKAAVGHWQSDNGIAFSGGLGFGIFGPHSRSHYSGNCGNQSGSQSGNSSSGNSGQSQHFSAWPSSGAAPLTVRFTATAPQGQALGNTVIFGDGQSGTLTIAPTCSSCNEIGTVSHTYTATGTYTASLQSGACSCPANGICNCPMMQILGTTTISVLSTNTGTSTASNIVQLNAPGSLSLREDGIAEVRNENYYFTLQNLTNSSATIQLTRVGCWNSFPSDTPPQIRCMIAVIPIAPQTLSIGQSYASGDMQITLTGISDNSATFSVGKTQ